MARNSLGVVPPDDEEERLEPDPRGESPQSRISINVFGIKFEASGKFLERKGTVIGLALIVMAVVGGILFAGSGVWTFFNGK